MTSDAGSITNSLQDSPSTVPTSPCSSPPLMFHNDRTISPEPIAICGMALRLPGGLSTPSQFWDMLMDKRDTRGPFPKTRFNHSSFFSKSDESVDLGALDTSFFRMPKPEVERLDPQQRLLLEVARECLESAGEINYRGRPIGTFVGSYGEDWQELQLKDPEIVSQYKVSGYGDFVLANRIAYEYNLQGPSMTIRTGCSAAMIGLHEACLSIGAGQCDAALVAGTNLIMAPGLFTSMSDNGVLSPDGSCKTFDATANGYARGEAVNMLYVKRLSSALRDGNPIRAVIRGTSSNADGQTPSFATPSSEAQERMIRKAYESAGIADISKTAFVECHGTGTATGDPIETTAVARIFGDDGIYIGSVKPNKTRLSPPNIKFTRPNPKIPFKDAKLQVPVEATPWPQDRCERISVNSFGIGGANAHVILESTDSFIPDLTPLALETPPSLEGPRLMLYSANTADSLQKQVTNSRAHVAEHAKLSADISYTLAMRRDHLPHRAFDIVVDGLVQTSQAASKAPGTAPDLVLVFTGQGAQWPQMGIELLKSSKKFRETFAKMDQTLQELPGGPSWRLVDELTKGKARSSMQKAAISQPLCTALQVALVDALFEVGLKPKAVVGHSSGEIAAAYAAGKCTLEEAIVAAYFRGVVSSEVASSGAMAAIGMGPQDVLPFLLPGTTIACYNSPESITLSGDRMQVESVVESIKTAKPGVFVRLLNVDTAYHSHHMAAVGDSYESLSKAAVRGTSRNIEWRPLVFSSVTGKLLDEDSAMDSKYWRSNLESPDATESFLSAIGRLWQQNIALDFSSLVNPTGLAKVVPDLPTYPWQHDHSLLFESRIGREWRFRRFPKHELLGNMILECNPNEPSFRNMLSLDQVPWLRDHHIMGNTIFPCAGYVGMAGEAARQICSGDFAGFALRNVVISTALVLHDSKPTEIVTSLQREQLTDKLESDWFSFTITSFDGSSWLKHCSGQVCARGSAPQKEDETMQKMPRVIQASEWYREMRRVGANYGASFRGLDAISCSTTQNTTQALATHTIHDDEEFYCVHPTKIDFMLQLFGAAALRGLGRNLTTLAVPTFIEKLEAYTCDSEINLLVNADMTVRGALHGTGSGRGTNGELALFMDGVRQSPLEQGSADNDDPHAGARLFWYPEVDFVQMSDMVKLHEDEERCLDLCQQLYLLCKDEALRRLEGVEATLPHLKKFHIWMKSQPRPTTSSNMEALKASLADTPYSAIANAVVKVLDNITAIFTGEVEALEVLLPDETLTKLYDSMNLSNREALFRALGHSRPCLRILEIGAGTGGTSNKVLDWLRGPGGAHMYSQYTYTDISAGFFGAAEERFKEYPSTEFRTLDISQDPTEQGFEPGSFDLIIAANVLHATPVLQDTLSNVRKLLHPEGRLYMEELCSDSKAINFVMGVLPGWWLGEGDGRAEEPYISPEGWETVLKGAGFEGIFDFAVGGQAPNRFIAHIIAKPSPALQRPKEVILLHDASSEKNAQDLRSQLMEGGFTASLHNFSTGIPPSDGADIIALLEVEKPYLENVTSDDLASLQMLVRSVAEAKRGLFWLTRPSQVNCTDPRWAQILGTARALRSELGVDFATCEVDIEMPLPLIVRAFDKFHRRIRDEHVFPEYEYVIDGSSIQIARLYPVSVKDELRVSTDADGTEYSRNLKIGTFGKLDTLHWETAANETLGDDQLLIEPKSVGLNFRDVLIAMGIVDSTSNLMGLEAAGVVRQVGQHVTRFAPGDRVLALGTGCFTTQLAIESHRCVKLPDSLSFEAGATMPIVYSTAIHGLLEMGRLQAGDSVLIHSACGGVGLAAIQVCQMVGATIYCTVSSDEKIRHLETQYGIPRDRIFGSRDASFRDDLCRATHGRGVDVVLNSLSGELLHASWDCVAEFGRMIEIGKRDLEGNGKLALKPFLLNRSYICVDVGHLADVRGREIQRLLEKTMELYSQGYIQPLHQVTQFAVDAVQEAFRFMQRGRHIGKIVVSMDQTIAIDTKNISRPAAATMDAEAAYLLIGGLGGLGRVIATWLVSLGARHIVYLSRTAGKPEDEVFFDELRSQGCNVTAVCGSVTSMADVRRAISASPKPLKGIMNMSMVLHDQLFVNMSHEEWTVAVQPKVLGTWNIHDVCTELGINLDFFLLFSSLSGIMGQRGQSNYASANTFLDSFVQYRQSMGHPAAVVDIGVMSDHGYVADNPVLLEQLRTQGMHCIRVAELLDSITAVLKTQPISEGNVMFSNPTQLVNGLRSLTPFSDPSNRVPWKGDRRMSFYFKKPANKDVSTSKAGDSLDQLKQFIAKVSTNPELLSDTETPTFISRHITMYLARLLLMPVENESEIDVNMAIADAGLDSLVAVEMRSWWNNTFGFDIGVLEILSTSSMLALGCRAIEGMKDKYVQTS
ncbi:hypothetical protein NQ176_g1174 [Zarea fungicola]|uniref:Uncharacterized protein n=1 Tax=Zarea fungicola TaxID=93591 RepID=A0ACC1NUF5_9HYPO|nr:hypothetical protein NQ176_g1174 [Lecanicillium fungicola]